MDKSLDYNNHVSKMIATTGAREGKRKFFYIAGPTGLGSVARALISVLKKSQLFSHAYMSDGL